MKKTDTKAPQKQASDGKNGGSRDKSAPSGAGSATKNGVESNAASGGQPSAQGAATSNRTAADRTASINASGVRTSGNGAPLGGLAPVTGEPYSPLLKPAPGEPVRRNPNGIPD